MRTKIALLFCLFFTIVQNAFADFTYNGVVYEKNGNGECQTKAGSDKSPGNKKINGTLIIPDIAYDEQGQAYKVTRIPKYSFASCNVGHTFFGENSITEVVIPSTVTEIGDCAFYGNTIFKIVIGKGVQKIDWNAFQVSDKYGCSIYTLGLKPAELELNSIDGKKITIHVPYGYKKIYSQSQWKGWEIVDDADIIIDEGIIYRSDPLESISKISSSASASIVGTVTKDITKAPIKSSVKTMFDVDVPVTKIEDNAFSDIKGIREVIIPDCIRSIGNNAFSGCSGLEKLILGTKVEEIGNSAFKDTKIKTLGLPSSVINIGEWVFANNTALEYVMLGKGLKTIGANAFYFCKNISEVEVEDLASWCGANIKNYAGNPMYYSGGFSLRGKPQTVLTIPAGVKVIEPYTFVSCKSINTLKLSQSVEEIGDYAFNHTGIERIDNTVNLTKIGIDAFSYCKSLEYVSFSEKMEVIDERAFENCTALKSLSVEKSLKSVGGGAFYGCKSLTEVNVGDGLGNVGQGAFNGCEALSGVNATSVGAWSVQSFVDPLSNPLWYAGRLTINGEELTDLILDDSIDKINRYSFIHCKSLQTVRTGDGVKTIGDQAFSGCENLKELTIGNNVESIGISAFSSSPNLSNVLIGRNVKTIERGIFTECINLRTVTALMEKAPLQTEACFEDLTYNNATLYVLPTSYSTYRITAPWSGFRKIREFEIIMDEEALGIVDGEKTLNVGDRFEIPVSTEPESLKSELVWTSSNPDVATVDNNGMVQTLHQGEADITVSAETVSKTIHINVISPVESITLNYNEITVDLGYKFELEAKILPEDATDPSVVWSSSNQDIVQIDNKGKAYAKSTGSAVITATTSNGLTAECKVEVILRATAIAIDYAASGIDGDELNMMPGENKEIKVVVYPAGSTDYLFWLSSNPNVADVNDGVVEAISEGKAVIKVESDSGKTAQITVNVGSASVEDILSDGDAKDLEIFDLQGVCICKKASAKELKSLDAEMYIVRYAGKTKKIIVR